ncbi:MAG: class I SAM-dependent methyltransferase [Ignavibacteriaceae bacterium]
MNQIQNSKERFSNRVENYIKYRPGYPKEIITFLSEEINFNSFWIVADIGSGTGILSKLFLDNGNFVFCVEPNNEMRKAGEQQLSNYTHFKSINGSSENTVLETSSIDLISAGQAFHWFDVQKSREEFKRILKKKGYVSLICNNRKTTTSKFLREYENLLINFSVDYKLVDHKNVNEKILSGFFNSYELKTFSNYQIFNFEELKGRLLSSSYAPMPEQSGYKQMIERLKRIFNQNKIDGKVKIEYDTELYYGIL